MSTNNIGFYEEKKAKLSLNYHQISSYTHIISSSVYCDALFYSSERVYAESLLVVYLVVTRNYSMFSLAFVDRSYYNKRHRRALVIRNRNRSVWSIMFSQLLRSSVLYFYYN